MAIRNRIFKFSHRSIEALPPQDPAASSPNVEFTDSVESGLKIAVYKSGRRSFRHRYTYLGVKKMMTLGEFPAVKVERARERVRDNKALLADDIDPQEERQERREAICFAEFVDSEFLPRAQKVCKGIKDLKCHLLPTFGDRPLLQIGKTEIRRWHQKLWDEISATTANRSLSLLSAILREALEQELIPANAARGVKKAPENGPRTRVLSSDELSRFVAALIEILDKPQGGAIMLLLALGLRKMEVLSLEWSRVDFGKDCLYIPENKTNIPRYVPLNSYAKEVLERMKMEALPGSKWVFPSRSASGHLHEIRRTYKTLLGIAGVDSYHIHDLRRQFATNLLNDGVSIYELKELLGHSDIRSTLVYARLSSSSLLKASETSATILNQEISKAS